PQIELLTLMFIKTFVLIGLYLVTGNPSVSRECPTGCASCSALNGCLSCRPRFFLHLELDGIRERGTCLSTCPRGYYGNRSPHINKCKRCKEECAFCFSENFCTRCHAGTFLIRGKCESSCPNGLTANAVLRECTVNCKVGEWTEWGPCLQKVNTEGYKKGEESRTRQVLQSSGPDGHPCPHVIEVRKCAIKDTERRRRWKEMKSFRHMSLDLSAEKGNMAAKLRARSSQCHREDGRQ
uniref:R-spondin 3 n=1 Tax=Cynoglossus semilaevis TaxID=244447 RepID=A0A3P8WSG6_CYNSE